MNNEKLNRLIEDTMQSMDGAGRAEPAPFLLTRINARLKAQRPSVWERISMLVSSPRIVFPAVGFVVMVNLFMYSYELGFLQASPGAETNTNMQASADVLTPNISTAFFDLENIQP